MDTIRTISKKGYRLLAHLLERKIRKGTLDEMITRSACTCDMSGTLSLHDLTKLIVDDNVFRVLGRTVAGPW